MLPADTFAASTAAPGSSRASTAPGIRPFGRARPLKFRWCSLPDGRSACRSCSPLLRPRPLCRLLPLAAHLMLTRRSPGRCTLLHRFRSLRQRGGAVRCRAKGAVQHGGGRRSRPVKTEGEEEEAKLGPPLRKAPFRGFRAGEWEPQVDDPNFPPSKCKLQWRKVNGLWRVQSLPSGGNSIARAPSAVWSRLVDHTVCREAGDTQGYPSRGSP